MGMDISCRVCYGFVLSKSADLGEYLLHDKLCDRTLLGQQLEIVQVGTEDCCQLILAVADSTVYGEWDRHCFFKPVDQYMQKHWDVLLQMYCEHTGVPYKQPQWILGGFVS